MTIKIAISGAAGNIGYALLPHLANGSVFGSDQPVELRLLEVPFAIKTLAGTQMELQDCAFPNLEKVECTTDPREAFFDADVIILVGGFPRKQGMARKDLIQRNTEIFSEMGKVIDAVASPDCKVLVVANPANTNCLVALQECSTIPSKNFAALTYLDHQRAKGQIAQRLGVPANNITNVTIWGNHSETQVPDALSDGQLLGRNGERLPLKSVFTGNDIDWVQHEFVSIVQNRGKAVIEARGSSSAMSAAMSIAVCLKKWLVTGTDEGETISLAIYNDRGYYNVQEGIVFSFPCECRSGEWIVKEGLELSDKVLHAMDASKDELLNERDDAMELIAASRKRSLSTASLTSSESESERLPTQLSKI